MQQTLKTFSTEKLTAYHEIMSRKIVLNFKSKKTYVRYENKLRKELSERYNPNIPAVLTNTIKSIHPADCKGYGKWIDRHCSICMQSLNVSPKYPKRKNPFA